MARPKPTVLLSSVDKRTYRAEQVLAADAIYSVFYCGQPINLRTVHTLLSHAEPKYKKVSFSNPAHCINLCKKLNEKFNTTDFTVRKFSTNDGVDIEF